MKQIKEFYTAYKHYTKVCKDNGIKIRHRPKAAYHADANLKEIIIPLPTSRANISVIYHEIGHLLHRQATHVTRYGRSPSIAVQFMVIVFPHRHAIRYECNANLWAIRNSPIPLSYKRLKTALDSYTNCERLHKPKKLLKKLNDQMLVRCKL